VLAACNFEGRFDAALISTYGYRANWGRVHWRLNDGAHAVTFGVTTQSLVNKTVCQTGVATTGISGELALFTRCGIVTSVHSAPTIDGDDGELFHVTFGRANYASALGDSGAAVVWPTAYGFGAAGIHHGKISVGGDPLFSLWTVLANDWNLFLSPP
jgi:hypothetical protein